MARSITRDALSLVEIRAVCVCVWGKGGGVNVSMFPLVSLLDNGIITYSVN